MRDDAHRLVGIILRLRPGMARYRGQRDGTGGEMQKTAARKGHSLPLGLLGQTIGTRRRPRETCRRGIRLTHRPPVGDLPHWSLSQWIQWKVKNVVKFIGEFERTL